ncbi:cyclase [Thiothrix eikelboomii]|uniref:imidazole glycerol-phosphate synthase n=1 Tax=Thiothrix eikelboomii TaxID=92487 RepID=A0A1T4XK51_9GAMM|nr:AglZ/HisF2 family acetamidino modification protein [Thiothrix eikelboomii]SKA89471.1 cyclase [Thiothrix eikelboomii]
MSFRLIPCLLLSNNGLVKTQRFKSPKYIGDPINAIRIFNEKEVDELILLDIDATKNRRPPNFALIEQLASECFMPFCYGGGVSSIEHVKTLFKLGVEKVSLQSSLAATPELIREISANYGEQAVVISVDVKKNWLGKQKIHSHAGVKFSSTDWREHITTSVRLGAGEVLLSSVDHDGMRNGMDIALIQEATKLVDVPITVMGGVGTMSDIKEAKQAGASAVAAGAYFVFQGPHKAVLITYPRYEEIANL